MKRSISRLLLSFIFLYVAAISLVFAAEEFISPEKAFESLSEFPEIKSLAAKYLCEKFQCIGHGFGTSVERWPARDYPFYILRFDVTQDVEKEPGFFLAKEIYGKLFYIDAYTAKVYPEDIARELISEKKIAAGAHDIVSALLIEKERVLKVELEKINNKIEKAEFGQNSEYKSLIQESMPILLKSLSAVTPEVCFQGVRIFRKIAQVPGLLGESAVTQSIPRLTALLKDIDYGIRYEAVNALGLIGKKADKKIIESILPLLKDSDFLVRRAAITALSVLGDSSLTPYFVDVLNDMSVNQEAVKGLARIGDERALEPLKNLFAKKDYFYLERDIIYAFGQVGGKKSIPLLVGLLDKKYDWNPKLGADFKPLATYMGVDAAIVLSKSGADAVPYLLGVLNESNYLSRLYSVFALNLIKDPASLPQLYNTLAQEGDPTLRIYIEKTIAEIKGEKFNFPFSDQLKVSIYQVKQNYKRKEEIKLFICFENKSDIPLVINTVAVKFGDVLFNVITPEGSLAAYIGPKYDKFFPFPGKDSLVVLKPKQIYKTGPFSMRKFYDFSMPGEYQITGMYGNNFSGIEYGVYAWVGKINSEVIKIKII